MRINNVQVYGVKESLIASGYPMQHGESSNHEEINVGVKDFKRGRNLGGSKSGSGHDCYLKGIIVQFDLRMSQLLYPQISRYHFIDFVSSQSKMHRIHKMNLDEQCNEHVDEIIKLRLQQLINDYNNEPNAEKKKELFLKVAYNIPMGLELTARMTTNYLQLKTIYYQRKNHKLKEWQDICVWIESLPLFKILVLGQNEKIA